MKKSLVTIILLSAGLMSQVVSAAPASSMLEWQGFVPGSFDGDEIGLTGQGGGDIQTGVLTVASNGTFTSQRPIVVEAHAIDSSGASPVVSPDLYSGDVDWSISSTNISHAAYKASDVTVLMNGEPITEGTPVTTNAGNHIVGFSVSSTEPTADPTILKPGDEISVNTLVFAQPSVGV